MTRDSSPNQHRRRPAGRREPEPVAPQPPAEAAPAPTPPPAPRPLPAAAAPTPRAPTDFDGLRAIGEMDPAEVRAMMDAFSSGPARPAFQAGQRVRARVSSVGSAVIFCDVGGKADAVLDRLEVTSQVAEGDVIDAFVHGTDGGEIRLTLQPSGSAVREMLQEAMSARITVDGRVNGVAEAGWDVALADGVRAFCPASHTGAPEPADPAHVGRTLPFHVHDMRGRDVVVSRKHIVEAEQRATEQGRLGELRVGTVVDGVVVSLRDFGAFVKLSNGAEGMVHLSNLSEQRVKHPSEVVKEGDSVRVRVLAIDNERRRLDLGLRQAVEISAGSAQAAAGFNPFAALLKDVRVKRA